MANLRLIVIISTVMMTPTNVFAKRIPSYVGPYRVIVMHADNSTEQINTTGQVWIRLHASHVSPSKPRDLQYFWGTSFNSIRLDDSLRGELRIAQRSNNQWKKNAFVMKFQRPCSDLKLHAKPLFDMIFPHAGGKCPVPPKGITEIRNQTADVSMRAVPTFPYGHWLYNFIIYRDNRIVGETAVEVETVPKV